MERADVIVIGGGIAGASAAYILSATRRVVVLERESQPGYHATGRSAALFTETYGNETVRALTKASRAFLAAPAPGFAEAPLLTPRGSLVVARADQRAPFETALEAARRLVPSVERIGAEAARARVPALRADYVADAFLEPAAMDIDVHALHHGFLRGLRARGGRLVTDTEVLGMTRIGRDWRVETRAGAYTAAIVVNAAGAWADAIARLAGIAPIGLVPKRRTAITFDAPTADFRDWPMVIDVDERFYFKPDAGRLLASPADETPVEPCDAQPEELDIAVLVDRLEQATTLRVARIAAKWAGLRSFVADKTPVAGFEPTADGFFWLAGQGGYGIQTSPAMAHIAACLIDGKGLPADVADLGVTATALSPARFRA
ncbi:MAG TPA: FAD-binding oxidoreductase [Alphaproteobacteria bacterium]